MRSIRDKIDVIEKILNEEDIEIAILTEHWMKKENINQLAINDYNLGAYFSRKDGYGGVLIMHRQNLRTEKIECIEKYSEEKLIEIAGIYVQSQRKIFIGVYRPPNGSAEVFFSKLRTCLEEVVDSFSFEEICIAGDFNIDMSKNSPNTRDLLEIMSDFGMYALFTQPSRVTHDASTLIDNIYSNIIEVFSAYSIEPHISDHRGQILRSEFRHVEPEASTKKLIRKMKPKNISRFMKSLEEETWSHINPGDTAEQTFSKFWIKFLNYFESSCPEKLVRLRMNGKKNGIRWNKEIREMKNHLDALSIIKEVKRDAASIRAYNACRKLYREKIIDLKKQRNIRMVEGASDKNKAVWNIIRNATSQKKQAYSKEIRPDVLANYLIQLGVGDIRDNHQKTACPLSLQKNIDKNMENSIFMKEATANEIMEISKKMKPKDSKDIYGMSSNLLKNIMPSIAEPLGLVFTRCLNEGHFPEQLKMSKVVPLFKGGKKSKPENYRPISILPALSKVFETLIKNRITEFLEKYDIICKNQHGYQKNKSTNSAITSLLLEVAEGFDNRKTSQLVTCDLSKAFDTINHDVLVEKLEYYGIRGVAKKLIENYLKSRLQRVSMDGQNSEWKEVKFGVPQGSILGPLLFLLYINDLPSNLQADLISLYVDDASFLNKDEKRELLDEKSKKTLKQAEAWFQANNMKMNRNKTQYLTFETRPTADKSLKFLGIFLEPNMKFKQHIESLTKKLSIATYTMRRSKQLAGKIAAKHAYFGYFHSLLSYGILFWGRSSESKRIFVKQKHAIRILCDLRITDSCRNHFRNENILTLSSIYILNCILYVYDNIKDFKRNEHYHCYTTRNAEKLVVPYHRVSSSQLSINHEALQIYNEIPEILKKMTRSKLKKELNKILVKKAYYSIEEFWNDKLSCM